MIEEKLKELKIKRYAKYGVGKKMGHQLWIHKNYIEDIIPISDFIKFEKMLPPHFNYELLRWDEKEKELAFISSPDFDIANEPLVGLIYRVKNKDNIFELCKLQKPPKDPLIYHHKWTFVKDDYRGFDVQSSKERTIEWKSILGVNKSLSSRIGRLSFWDQWLESENLLKRI